MMCPSQESDERNCFGEYLINLHSDPLTDYWQVFRFISFCKLIMHFQHFPAKTVTLQQLWHPGSITFPLAKKKKKFLLQLKKRNFHKITAVHLLFSFHFYFCQEDLAPMLCVKLINRYIGC